MELRPTSAGNGSSLTLAESKFLQKIFEALGVPSLLKLRNPLRKTLLDSWAWLGVWGSGPSSGKGLFRVLLQLPS